MKAETLQISEIEVFLLCVQNSLNPVELICALCFKVLHVLSFSLLDTLLLIHQRDDHVSISISIGNTAGVLTWFWINTKFYWVLSLHLAHTDIKDTDTAHLASYREQLTVFP